MAKSSKSKKSKTRKSQRGGASGTPTISFNTSGHGTTNNLYKLNNTEKQKQEIEDVKKENKRLQEEVAESFNIRKKLNTENVALRHENEILNNKYTTEKFINTRLTAENDGLKSTNNAQSAQIHKLQQELQTLNQQFTVVAERTSKTDMEHRKLVLEYHKIKQNLTNCNAREVKFRATLHLNRIPLPDGIEG